MRIVKHAGGIFEERAMHIMGRRGRRNSLNTYRSHSFSTRSFIAHALRNMMLRFIRYRCWSEGKRYSPPPRASGDTLANQDLLGRPAALRGEMPQTKALQSHKNEICRIQIK